MTTTTDIFNRPPHISEDTLQYALYPPKSLSDKVSVTTLAACIQTYIDGLLVPEFLWHRDPFELKVVKNEDIEMQWMLEGRMRVGDCVDDEWCAVWLLKEVSAKWDLVISVFDSDGEFLLIEAADALPSWVTPSNSENRVWIYSSHLYLIPLSHVSPPSRKRRRRTLHRAQDSDDEDKSRADEEDGFIAVEDALKIVRDGNLDTLAPVDVEALAWKRIGRYPQALKRHVHATNAWIPLDIAKALSVRPSLVQKAVEAFYTRDAAQLRAAHKMARFPPDTSVLSTVHMTRTAYAQLSGQKFYPPKVFGSWSEADGTKERRWRDAGMKIAVGFEILFQESKPRTSVPKTSEMRGANASAKKDALQRDLEYQKYIQNLVSAGYFRGELEGSQTWNNLEDKAVDIFIAVRRDDDQTRESFQTSIDIAISQSTDKSLYVTGDEEDDTWLSIDADDFDDLLKKSTGLGSQAPMNAMDVDDSTENAEERLASEQANRLKEFASKVEEFVEGEGDIEGARFRDEAFSDEEFSDNDDSDSEPDEMKRQEDMDKLVPTLPPGEYGQMPASFHKSQRVGASKESKDVKMEDVHHPEVKPAKEDFEFKPLRQPIITRDRYDGVDSDDETDEEDEEADSEDEEYQPQVVGDVEVDMGQEEEEFLEFSRQALGINDEQWADIINERKERGAFVPKTVKATAAPNHDPRANKPVHRAPEAGPRPNINPNLDSFETVMMAMDAELARTRSSKSTTAPPTSVTNDKGKGKAKAPPTDEVKDFEDIDAEMEAELKAAFEEREGDEEPMDYNMIKNFLESFKSQAGLSGPVSNLAGRLQPGWSLPRDDFESL